MTEFRITSDADLLKATLFNRARLGEGGCWVWVASRDGRGYGLITRNNKTQRAHRVSYAAYKGAIPSGFAVLHSCDNPSCINPDHLRVGTQKENAADRKNRGRGADLRGEDVGTAKLTTADVLAIKASKLPQSVLSKTYGVDVSNIWAIRSGKSWKHLNAATCHNGE